MRYKFIKQLADYTFALTALTLLMPLFLIIILLQIVFNKRLIFFKQPRPGLNKKVFTLYKFATMNNKKDLNGNLISEEYRITKFGKILRKYSLDELPQLLNVLKGDMSFVGPRPLLVEYLKLYNEEQNKRHLVKPGITGYAQINGRNSISWSKKLELDVWYVNNINFLLDLLILFKSIKKVIKGEDVSKKGFTTTSKFSINE